MTLITAKWNLTDYHRMISAGILEGKKVELLNGEIVEMSPEGEIHASASDEAGEYLIYLFGSRAKVRQAKPITLLQNNSEPVTLVGVAIPDIAIVQRLGKAYQDHHPYPENIFWLIEYSHTSLSKDIEVKTKVYAEAGIAEYWVINLQKIELIVFRVPQNTGYQSQEIFTEGEIRPLAFPDVAVSVQRLLGL